MTTIPRSHRALLAALMLAQLLCGALASVASSDTSRDLFFAQQIASLQGWPLTGPAINAMLHLGPLWYYLLAMPLLLVPNAATVTATMGLMSATQFPLAYALGRRWRDARTGLLFALALAMPGWGLTAFGSYTHPVIAIPSLLLAVFAAMAYRERPDAWRALVLGASFALMATAHPTLVSFAAMLTAWCAPRAWRGVADVAAPDGVHAHSSARVVRAIGHAVLVALPVLLCLAPMLFDQWRTGFADVQATTAYTESEWSWPSPVAAVELVFAFVAYGPQFVTRYWLALSATQTAWLFALYCTTLGVALSGLVIASLHRRGTRRMILVLLGVLLLHAMFLCAIRERMPPWMVYVLWAPIAALLAIGFAQVSRAKAGRVAVALLLAATTAWSWAVYAKLAQGDTRFANINPSPGRFGMMDVRDYEDRVEWHRISRVPLRELYELGSMLCEPVTLHGHVAFLVDYTYAVSAARVCGDTSNIAFGGPPTATRTAIVGLHRDAWTAMNTSPGYWIGDLGFTTPRAVWHSPVALAPVLPTFSNFPRLMPGQATRFTVQGEGARVLVSHRAHRYTGFRVLDAWRDGERVAPVYADLTSAIYEGDGAWRIEIEANPDYVDVLSLP